MKTIIISDISKDCYMNPSDSIVYIDANSGVKYQAVRSGNNTVWKRYSEVAAGSNISLNEPAFDDPSANKSIINASAGSAFAGFTEVYIDANNSSLANIYKISSTCNCKIIINNEGYVQFPPYASVNSPLVFIYINAGYTDLSPCASLLEYENIVEPMIDQIPSNLIPLLKYKGNLVQDNVLDNVLDKATDENKGNYYTIPKTGEYKYYINDSKYSRNVACAVGDWLLSTGATWIRIVDNKSGAIVDDIKNGDGTLIKNNSGWEKASPLTYKKEHPLNVKPDPLSHGTYFITLDSFTMKYHVLRLGDSNPIT